MKYCNKIILSDAHIKNNVIKFINNRVTDKIIFIKSEYQKYKGVKAYHINNANEYLNQMKERIKNNEYFVSGGDNRKEQHKLYNECYKIATKEQK